MCWQAITYQGYKILPVRRSRQDCTKWWQPGKNVCWLYINHITQSNIFLLAQGVKLSRQEQMWHLDLILIPYRLAALTMYKMRLFLPRHVVPAKKCWTFPINGWCITNKYIFLNRGSYLWSASLSALAEAKRTWTTVIPAVWPLWKVGSTFEDDEAPTLSNLKHTYKNL